MFFYGISYYVRNVDLRGKKPRNPEEALAQHRSMAGKDRPIPLYDVDGKKVIGTFIIEAGNVIEIPAEEIPEEISADENN